MNDAERVDYYADHFSSAARSGINSAKSIYPAIATIQLVDTSTFDVLNDAVVAKNNLFVAIRNSYENIFSNAESTNCMEASFEGLAAYVLEISQQSFDDYLTAEGITVPQTFADISSVFGILISDSNITEDT